MALAADKGIERKDGVELPFPVAGATTIYGGGLVAVNAAGYLLPGADTAGLIFQGIAIERVANTGANGAKQCVVRRRGLIKCAIAAAAQANVGDHVYLVDDETVGLVADVSNAIFCGVIAGYIDATHVWVDIDPAILQADVAAHIADTSNAHMAAAIGIADAGSFTAQSTVEAALQEIFPKAPVAIADPGDAGAIPVTRSGSVGLTSGGSAETRTLAIPGLAGITLAISHAVDGGGAITIAVASAINQTGNNRIALQDAGDTIVLAAVLVGAVLAWRVVVNDGCTLSTV